MQPNGEQPNRPDSGRPPLSRTRSMDGVSPPIHRRPMQPMARRPYVDRTPPNTEPQAQPAPIDNTPQPAEQPVEPTPNTPEPHPYVPVTAPVQESTPSETEISPSPAPQPYQPAINQPTPDPAPQQPETMQPSAPAPNPYQNPQPATPAPTPIQHEAPKPHEFKPAKPKKRKKILIILAIVVASLLVIAGIVSLARAQAAWNNPDKAMKDAITNNLKLKKVQSQTQSESINSTTEYDFTSLKNPIISTESSIPQPKGPINMTGYGSVKNNYFSYTKLPSNLNSQGVKNAIDAVVQTREDGVKFKGVDGMPEKVSDPRYQVISPLLIGITTKKHALN